ncbi:MAG: glycosyl transferase group 1 [Rhodocyclales bacterium]|nr:glycosyl transferase group 1 [Rhodocyclales bacterium]
MKNHSAIFTIVSNNYLHFARTLLQSAAVHQPEAKRYCVITDVDHEPALALGDEFEIISLGELGLPDGQDFIFQYNILEFNTAVKPWALQHLLKGHQHVIYIDPDIRLYRAPSEVHHLLTAGADIVLTPHLLAPLNDDLLPTELDIRRAGTYNLGFCALRDSKNTHDFLDWWQSKLRHDCVVKVDEGIFVDQSWIDLVPGLFENVAVLRHPGYNVAYWNLGQREFSRHAASDEILVNGQPLVFFHFSGLELQKPQTVSKHQNRFTLKSLTPSVRTLIEDYVRAVIANGADSYGRLEYGFDRYSDGSRISAAERVRFRDNPILRERCGQRPFEHPEIIGLNRAASTPVITDGTRDVITDIPRDIAIEPVDIDPVDQRRLDNIYRALLGRLPEPGAYLHRGRHLKSRMGMLRTLVGVGLSREARATPGWQARLLRFAGAARMTPDSLKRWLIRPLSDAMARLERIWPALAYQSAAGSYQSAMQDRTPPPVANAITNVEGGRPFGINLVGYLRTELGVGEAARSLARACLATNIPFSATEAYFPGHNPQRDDSIIGHAQPTRFAVDLLYVNADQTSLACQQLADEGRPKAAYTIGFWHWEQPEFPTVFHDAFTLVDEVWVASTFVHDAISAVSPVPVFKVPHSLQFDVTPGASREQFGLPADRQLILVMYDFNSYQYRKNPQAAIAAYRLAAQAHPQLALVIKTMNSQQHAVAYRELRDSMRDLEGVFFIDDFLSRQQTWDLQFCCDILLSLHRAEGFGLALAEMMYLGKPVVATNWSANVDFMNVENSMPVRYRLKPLEMDIGAYPAGPLWAEADIAHAAECLGRLASQPDLVRRLGERAMHDVRHQLGPHTVGLLIRQRLEILGRWHPELDPQARAC